MCSYQNISDKSFRNDWAECWVDPNQNVYEYDSSQYEMLQILGVEPNSDKNCTSVTTISENQIQTSSYQESSSLLSPTWDDSTSPPQNPVYTSMSSYFSTFDPSAQIQEDNTHIQYPVTTTPSSIKAHARFNFVPTKKEPTNTPIKKRKRKRTVFTTEQVEALEKVFAKRPYVTRDERQILVERLQVNDKSVKIWFQNRRLKNKRDDQCEVIEADNSSNIFERLNAIESKIFERVDELGFVTLDDKIMSDLVNVIDDYFTSKANYVEPKREMKSMPIYEPISPASSEENVIDDNETHWEHKKDSNDFNMQDLIDLESIIVSM